MRSTKQREQSFGCCPVNTRSTSSAMSPIAQSVPRATAVLGRGAIVQHVIHTLGQRALPPQAARKILGWISGIQIEIRWLGF